MGRIYPVLDVGVDQAEVRGADARACETRAREEGQAHVGLLQLRLELDDCIVVELIGLDEAILCECSVIKAREEVDNAG